MNKLLALLLTSVFASVTFAAAHTTAPMTSAANPKPEEAMKAGSEKAQAKVDAKVTTGDKTAMQPEAMKAGSEKAQAKADMKKDGKAKVGKKASTDEQMKNCLLYTSPSPRDS